MTSNHDRIVLRDHVSSECSEQIVTNNHDRNVLTDHIRNDEVSETNECLLKYHVEQNDVRREDVSSDVRRPDK